MTRKTITIDEPTWQRLNAAKDAKPGEPRKESAIALINRALDCLEKQSRSKGKVVFPKEFKKDDPVNAPHLTSALRPSDKGLTREMHTRKG